MMFEGGEGESALDVGCCKVVSTAVCRRCVRLGHYTVF